MPPLIWESRPDGLRAPAVVCAFSGWNDAGDAASAALTFVGSSLGAERFARIDPEEFFDFQSTRPKIELTEGRIRDVEWPWVEVYAARVPRAPRDLVLISGAEPSMRWRTAERRSAGTVSSQAPMVAGQTTPADALSETWLASTERTLAFYRSLRDAFAPDKPMWLSETAEAACGDTLDLTDQTGHPLADVPSSATRVYLNLDVELCPSTAPTASFDVHRVTSAWQESAVTWNTRPGIDTSTTT